MTTRNLRRRAAAAVCAVTVGVLGTVVAAGTASDVRPVQGTPPVAGFVQCQGSPGMWWDPSVAPCADGSARP